MPAGKVELLPGVPISAHALLQSLASQPEGAIEQIAVVFKWKDGPIKSGWSYMNTRDLAFLKLVLDATVTDACVRPPSAKSESE